jgi:hypothetical protein
MEDLQVSEQDKQLSESRERRERERLNVQQKELCQSVAARSMA